MRFITLALLMAVILPAYVHAQLVITKVMANPAGSNAGRQWIQISNTGTTSVDLGAKDIRLYTTSGNHLIKEYANGGTVLTAGSVGVIAENPTSYLIDFPNYIGPLFKSSFTLPITGIVGIIQTDGTMLVKKAYTSPVLPKATKPKASSKSTTKRATTTSKGSTSHVTAKSKSSYDSTGTLAPAAAASAAAAGPCSRCRRYLCRSSHFSRISGSPSISHSLPFPVFHYL